MSMHTTGVIRGMALAALCVSLMICPLALAKSAVSLPGLVARPAKLKLRADHLAAAPAADCAPGRACATRMVLRGRVFVGGGGLRIEAPLMRVLLGKDGQAVSIEAEGKVQFSLGKRRGRAKKLSYAVRRGVLVLEGDARLDLPRMQLKLAGKRMQVDLRGGSVSVSRARVEMEVRAK